MDYNRICTISYDTKKIICQNKIFITLLLILQNKLNVSYDNLTNSLNKQIEAILNDLKEKTFPIIKTAHFFPAINEIGFLSDNEKRALDEALYKFSNGYVVTNKNIVSREYQLFCGCKENNSKTIMQREYDDHVEYFDYP